MMARLRQLAGARSGAAAMEMVLITPVVAGMMFVAMDFSGAWLRRLQLEQAAQRGIEAVASRRGVSSTYDYALAEAQAAYSGTLTRSALDNWLECNGVRQANLTANCGSGQRARYVSIRLDAEYAPSFGWGGLLSGTTASGGFPIMGDAVVRVQ